MTSACFGDASSAMGLRNVEIGASVPAFSVRALDGTTVERDAFQDRVLLVVFTRPDHEKSLKALIAAQSILEANADAKLSVLAVATQEEADQYFRRIVAENHLTYPIALDPQRKMYGDFGVVVAPTTLLIDGGGILRFVIPHLPISYDRQLRLHTELLLGKITTEDHQQQLAQADESKVDGQDPWTRRLGLARILIDQRNWEQAVPILTKLCAERDDPLAAALLGTALLELNRVDEAATYLEPLAKRELKSPKIMLALARLELRRGNDNAAEQYLTGALAISPAKGPILFELGRIHEKRGDLNKAVECYRQALEELLGSP
ncbi:MAG: tetratricopeptide repeat protein [Planctomycetes bacterium]|nr:tetratricopeptide repeat protein [Planctomycetota bacterium]